MNGEGIASIALLHRSLFHLWDGCFWGESVSKREGGWGDGGMWLFSLLFTQISKNACVRSSILPLSLTCCGNIRRRKGGKASGGGMEEFL